MKTNSTHLCTVLIAVFIFFINTHTTQAQCVAPGMKFINPVLIAGTHGTINAKYKFPTVVTGVDAIVTITDIVGGASLASIDDNTFGYGEAWQPVVKTPIVMGAVESFVKFKMDFVDASNESDYVFICFTMSAIDVDGDNDRVREMIAANDFDSYAVSNVTTLSLTNHAGLLKATSTVLNFAGIDTSAYVTNINYRYVNKSKINEIRIGSVTNETFIPQDRFSCIYFRPINITNMIVLPAQLLTLNSAVKHKNVVLNWQSNEDLNVTNYVVERSTDGIIFSPINTNIELVDKNNLSNYQAVDATSAVTGKTYLYYRIKQKTISGKISYSNLSYVHFTQKPEMKVEIFPNPFVEKIKLQFTAETKGIGEIRISNIAGVELKSKKLDVVKGLNNAFVDGCSTLAPGVYLARLFVNGELVETKKIMK